MILNLANMRMSNDVLFLTTVSVLTISCRICHDVTLLPMGYSGPMDSTRFNLVAENRQRNDDSKMSCSSPMYQLFIADSINEAG